jgi:hypothetical protein
MVVLSLMRLIRMRNLTLPGSSSSMAAAPSSSNSGPSEKLDVDALTDVMGYAGIDLRVGYSVSILIHLHTMVHTFMQMILGRI